MRLTKFSFTNTYGLLWVKNQSSVAAVNAYKRGDQWVFNVAHGGNITEYSSWGEAKAAFMALGEA
jgi:hypothetical protein